MGFSAEDQVALLKQLGVSVGRQGGWLLFMILPPLFIVVGILLGRMGRNVHKKMPRGPSLENICPVLEKNGACRFAQGTPSGPPGLCPIRRPAGSGMETRCG